MIPNNEMPGACPGALSRADNKTEICSECGLDEALTQWMDGYIAAVEEWPIAGKHALTLALNIKVEDL